MLLSILTLLYHPLYLLSRGKKPKPRSTEAPVIAIVPDANSSINAVVQGSTIKGVLDIAAKTVESIYEEAYKSEDINGKLVVKTKRKAKLKKPKATNKEKEKNQ